MRKTLKTLLLTVACALLLIGGVGALGAFTAEPAQANPTVQADASTAAPAAATSPDQKPADAMAKKPVPEISVTGAITSIAKSTGVAGFLMQDGWKSLFMIGIGFVLLYLGVVKDFEPMLLVPIGFGTILVNVPFAGMGDPPHGLLYMIFEFGLKNELLPLLVFIGIGALSDFGPLLANPRVAILGAAAQFGVFGTLLGVMALNLIPGFDY